MNWLPGEVFNENHTVDALKSDNQSLQQAGVAMVKEIEDDEIVEAVNEMLPKLPEKLRKQLGDVLQR